MQTVQISGLAKSGDSAAAVVKRVHVDEVLLSRLLVAAEAG
jgi:hypothetical protein